MHGQEEATPSSLPPCSFEAAGAEDSMAVRAAAEKPATSGTQASPRPEDNANRLAINRKEQQTNHRLFNDSSASENRHHADAISGRFSLILLRVVP